MMNKLFFVALMAALIQLVAIQPTAAEHPETVLSPAVVTSTGFTLELRTTASLSGLQIKSEQVLQYKDGSGNNVSVNATVTGTTQGANLTVDFTTNDDLTGLTIEDQQQLGFTEIVSSSSTTVDFVVEDHIIH